MRCYEREENFWIGNQYEKRDIAIVVFDLPVQLYIRKNEVLIKGGAALVSHNGSPGTHTGMTLEEGDVLSFGGISITFFASYLEIEGDEERYHTALCPCRGEDCRFAGFPFYKRSPRIIYRVKKEKIEVLNPPPKREMSKGGLAQLVIPPLCMLTLTVVMGLVMKRGAYIFMSAGMTAVTTIFSIQRFFAERKEIKKENRGREELYDAYLLRMRAQIRRLRKEEKTALAYQNPDLRAIGHMISRYSSRIYERNILDDDFMTVNLGYYRGSSGIRVTVPKGELELKKDELTEQARELQEDFGYVDKLPVRIDLKKAHLGIAGSKSCVHEQLKYLLAQLTFFQSYRDLQIILIHAGEYEKDFAYTDWYPHLQIGSINVSGRISCEQARDQILGSIRQILKDRRLKLEEEKQNAVFSPYYLFIIDEPKLILNHSIMEYLQGGVSGAGFGMIYTTDQVANLPENVKTVCLLQDSDKGTLLLKEGEKKDRDFEICRIGETDLEKTARDLNALVHEQGVSSRIPESVTFFELYGIGSPKELQVEKRWAQNESHKSLAVPLGVRAKEDYVELNLHEKAHGPHGLVAGTTGSGKSEIVQSYILSLAVNFHPHEVGFLLIDYKGGGMANLFKKLPHLLGTITNLDKAESMRAMASIKSELARRQRIFGDNNVNHINGYNKLFKLGKVAEPLPHLFLISDEFAELKKEQPDFMSELVSAARIGRSLGIHLILATQKPSGVVDDQIWTNSKFKLCLKVQNEGDSKEMLRTPDAANITQAGRAYLQVGNNEIYELFQSAWSGAPYSGEETEEETEDDRVYLLNDLGQGELINKDLSGPVQSSRIRATQLDVVVEHLQEVYQRQHAAEVKKPWLPSLPAMLEAPYKEVKDSALFEEGDYRLGLGMTDIPDMQAQEEYVLDLIKNGHMLYMASGGYGKTVLLTQIVLGLSMKNAVRNLNFYILDLGNSGLIPLKGLPHVADYMGLDDTEKIGRFQKMMLEEIAERKRKFARAMAQNISVYNSAGRETLKILVLVIDHFDAYRELGDSAEQFIQKVARDGGGLGIYLLISMTRINAMRSVVMNNIKERIAGYNFDDGENRSLLGRSDYTLPEDKKGRALVKQGGVNIMQLYTPVACENALSYNAGLQELIQQIRTASTEKRAQGIPVLPEELYGTMLPDYPGYRDTPTEIPVGIDTEKLEVQYLDLSRGIGMIVGSSGTGRTNVLRLSLDFLKDRRVWLIDAEKRSLADYRKSGAAIRYGAGYEACMEILKEIGQACRQRKEDYEEAALDDVSLTLYDYAAKQEPAYVVIDVIQELYAMLEREGKEKELDILEEAGKLGMYVIVTSDIKIPLRAGKFMELLSESKKGIILGNIKEQRIFDYMGIREENHDIKYGYRHAGGANQKIMIAKQTEG